MAKKFRIKDESGESYEVEELDEEPVVEKPTEETHDDESASLTPDEINALKQLAAVAPKLIALISTTDLEQDPQSEIETNDCGEKVVSTDSKTKTKDSRQSFGSVEQTTVTDAKKIVIADDSAIAEHYAKRLGK